MALPPYDHHQFVAALAERDAVAGFAAARDVDEAFDLAVTAELEQPNGAGALVTADPGTVQVIAEATSIDLAAAAALRWLDELHTSSEDAPVEDDVFSTVAAIPILARSAHVRTTRRGKVEGLAFNPDSSPAAQWGGLDDDLAAALAEVGVAAQEGEVLERVEIVRRARYRPVAVSLKGASTSDFVVLEGNTIVSSGHPTAGKARAAAVELLKAFPAEDHVERHYEVRKLTGRPEGQPLVSIVRTRATQRLSVKAVYAALKPATKEPQPVGWMFVVPTRSA